MDVGLHHRRVQGHIDAPTGREQRWEERPGAVLAIMTAGAEKG